MSQFRVVLALLGLGVVSAALTGPAEAVDKADVDKAIERGVTALKKMQASGGGWSHPDQGTAPINPLGMTVGMSALAGLTLLECDVPPDDPSIRSAVRIVREGVIMDRRTYNVALAIMFLDRCGDPDDAPLIEALTVRLLGGQSTTGGWGYSVPTDLLDQNELKRLSDDVGSRAVLKTKPDFGRPDPDGNRAKRELSPETRKKLEIIATHPMGEGEVGLSDNSNTQFAIFALWVARRHGLPVENAIGRLVQRFRASQNADGGWDYVGVGGVGVSRPTMTCAGLIGLAIGCGAVNAHGKVAIDPTTDPFIKGGLIALGSCIDPPFSKTGREVPKLFAGQGNRTYYFLWGLERVCMAFDLKTIGGKDWYAWGAELALANQQADGSWQGEYGQCGADTCFTLLFLRRANLAGDLTAMLRGKVKDSAQLHAGGIGGGELLKGKGLKKSAIERETTPDPRRPNATVKAAPRSRPVPKLEGDAGRFLDALLQATGAKQDQLVDKYRDSKGKEYTEALAAAIPQMTGDSKKKAREALAERLSRMTSATLADKLSDDNFEVRRAAAIACAMKEDKAHLATIVNLLNDVETPVQRAAYAALKALTQQDFGPAANATKAEHAKAVADWKAWLTKHGPP